MGYIYSLHHLASYIESEELQKFASKLSGIGGKYIREAVSNPRISLQLTIFTKSFTMIISSFLAILTSRIINETYGLNFIIILIFNLLIIWAFYLFFMEYLPGRRALKQIDIKIIRFVPLFSLLYLALLPVLWVYNRILHYEPTTISEEHREEIIERAIETLAAQAGASEPIVEKSEKEMIGQILQLDVTEVREIMVPRIGMVGLGKTAGLRNIRRMTEEHGHSRYPVYDENLDNIMGILYVKDLFTNIPLPIDEANFDITKYIRKPYFIPESKKINDLLSEFKLNRVHIAIVVDEYGGTSGMITMEDILEEIVGDIQDEHDYEEEEMVKMPDNSIMVDAGTSVEELVEELKLDYGSEEFETVGGLIYDLVGSVPTVGTRLKWKDILFEVAKVEGQRIISVKARVEMD
jgi:CBS domain containing-hemolysin-like protein